MMAEYGRATVVTHPYLYWPVLTVAGRTRRDACLSSMGVARFPGRADLPRLVCVLVRVRDRPTDTPGLGSDASGHRSVTGHRTSSVRVATGPGSGGVSQLGPVLIPRAAANPCLRPWATAARSTSAVSRPGITVSSPATTANESTAGCKVTACSWTRPTQTE